MNMLLFLVSAVFLPMMVLAAPSSPYERTSDDLMNSETDSDKDETTIQLVNQAKSSDPNARLAAVFQIRGLFAKGAEPNENCFDFLKVLVECLESTDDNLLVEAAGALANIADREARGETMSYNGVFYDAMHVAEADAVPSLVKLLKSPNLEVLKQTVRALANIASFASFAHARKVVEAGAVPRLVKLLQSPNMEVCEYTALALSSIANDEAREVVEAGAVPLLVSLLQSPNMKVCENAATALKGIAGASYDLGLAVIEAGALRPLLNLLKSQNNKMCEEAAWAIDSIIEKTPDLIWHYIDVEHVQIMMENEVVESFCNLLGGSNEEITRKVLDGLKRVLKNAQNKEKVIKLIDEYGGLQKIKRLNTKESKLVLKMIEKQQSSK